MLVSLSIGFLGAYTPPLQLLFSGDWSESNWSKDVLGAVFAVVFPALAGVVAVTLLVATFVVRPTDSATSTEVNNVALRARTGALLTILIVVLYYCYLGRFSVHPKVRAFFEYLT